MVKNVKNCMAAILTTGDTKHSKYTMYTSLNNTNYMSDETVEFLLFTGIYIIDENYWIIKILIRKSIGRGYT